MELSLDEYPLQTALIVESILIFRSNLLTYFVFYGYPVFPLVPDDEEEIYTKRLKSKLHIKVGNRHQVYVWWQDMSSNLQISAEFEMEKERREKQTKGQL